MSGEAKARGKGKKGGYRGKKGSHTEEEEISNGIGNGHGEKNLLACVLCLFVCLCGYGGQNQNWHLKRISSGHDKSSFGESFSLSLKNSNILAFLDCHNLFMKDNDFLLWM